KSEEKNPLVGKEQARTYARSQNCRFIILSNGNQHYFWNLEHGNPHSITDFPTPDSATAHKKFEPNPQALVDERVGDDYIVLTQRPNYANEAAWKNENEREDFKKANKLRFLRPYQLRAIHALQRAVREGGDRFLFEMATGTGKTLTAAAVIKLFLRTGNARRVLFLVDRLELEDQAYKAFRDLLSADCQTVIYKQNRDDWRRAEIVVTTVQSLQFDNKYRRLFSPTDFDLVISDEAHRSIGGNARAVFDYFVGCKLGLTATPRDYLKNFDEVDATIHDPRAVERRLLRDTYRTFGCESGEPTFRYSLLDGVREGYLINPTVVDARTDVTTQLLSEQGFVAAFTDDEGEEHEEIYKKPEFEKRFYAEATNQLFCKTFVENALRDPVSGDIGKAIVFAVSQNHEAKLAQILNEIADRMFPGQYQSDFAVQVTSQVADAQQYTINFVNNNLRGWTNFLDDYRTSKARVCVTVGMMTTGYDCTDVLNIGLFRPIFSPSDFVQIKGRGTRRHDFREQLTDDRSKEEVANPQKTAFKLFDFFANCEYFETEFNYDEVLKLPQGRGSGERGNGTEGNGPVQTDGYEYLGEDILSTIEEETIGPRGMKVDRMLFERFGETVRGDVNIAAAVRGEEWERARDYVRREVFDKPEEYYNLEKLRRAAGADRRLTLREILEKVFGFIPDFKSKRDLLDEEFAKFIADHEPDEADAIPAMRSYFEAYATSDRIRAIIDEGRYTALATEPALSLAAFRNVPEKYRSLIPDYVKDYVSLNRFAPYP
ncbi:MAG: DEAD/DEAH box helicase family protein, partial [Nitrospinae bacterium]|nr:DEAD/DEAH box helicase family protein [Nitrospinota bacterium]